MKLFQSLSLGPLWLAGFSLWMLLLPRVSHAYQVLITDMDQTRQVCSGMWGSGGTRDPYIEVVFSPGSTGSLALVIYEWQDAMYLGIDSDGGGRGDNQWEEGRVYICTLAAERANLCPSSSLGEFIVTTPIDVSPNSTSIFTTSVRFDKSAQEDDFLPQGSTGPFRYPVSKTGYYCVGAVPVTFEQPQLDTTKSDAESSDDSINPFAQISYTGVVDFENVFKGHLPAAEYPKIGFYAFLTFIYVVLGLAWGYACYKHRDGMLALQKYVGMTIGFIVVEMLFIWAYYGYLNAHGARGWSHVLLVIVAVLNSARNALSFFLLCIVCMGYGVVRPSLGSVMIRVKALAAIHFVFGILYSVGTVSIPLESAGYFILLMVFPLAFSLTAFMMWIMWSLNATIADLEARKQTYKKNMFVKLYRVLLCAVVVIAAFFVISSISFSSRLDEDYAPDTWKTRWWLLDGWLSLLYFAVFAAVAWLWRPSDNNRRLAMSDELATDEDDLQDVEFDHLNHNKDDDDEEQGHLRRDEVVFDIGEDEDETPGAPRQKGRKSSLDEAGDAPEVSRLTDSRRSSGDETAPPAYDR